MQHSARLDISRLASCAASLAALLAMNGCTASHASAPALRQVVLFQNGIGYFEHAGRIQGRRLDLAFPDHEIDDVLKTLTIVSARQDAGIAATVNAFVPEAPAEPPADQDGSAEQADRIGLSIELDRPAQDVVIAYAVPTPIWKASYRLVLPQAGEQEVLLQAWATINNTSQQDWRQVELTLATGAPLSFAIDLHTPEYMARPDLGGKLVEPVATGAVLAARGLPGDRDGDGVQDQDDACPAEPEDRNGHDDHDGCPDPDQDADRIPDTADQCPTEPETYNGVDDDDGCPDRGRVVVSSSSIEILDKIYFQRGSAEIWAPTRPILDAVAATLQGNPDILAIEIQGHASQDETGAWELSGGRARAVERALRERGVDTRLRAESYGPTQPIDTRSTEQAHARNRRVEFLILERADEASPPAGAGAISAARMQDSVRASVQPSDVAGSVRYRIAEPVTIRRGAAALVPILNQTMPGEDVYLFRPDANALESAQHPWRAGRFVNAGPLPLQPGPVAVFAGGTFVGEGLIERLHADETALVPYALDSATTVRESGAQKEEPVRLVTMARGVITVENRLVRTTRYHIHTGTNIPARMFVHHAPSADFEVFDLPPHSQDTGDGYLVPIPLAPARTSVLEIKERQPVRRSIHIADLDSDLKTDLEVYVSADEVPDALRQGIRAAIAQRKRLAAIDEEILALTDRLLDVGERAGEIRESLQALGPASRQSAKARALRRKLLDSLSETTAESERIGRELAARRVAQAEARTRLRETVDALSFGPEQE